MCVRMHFKHWEVSKGAFCILLLATFAIFAAEVYIFWGLVGSVHFSGSFTTHRLASRVHFCLGKPVNFRICKICWIHN